MTKPINQKQLLYKAQVKHDPEAFAQLYDIYVKPIYRFVYFKVSDKEEAQDITSEVFLKAWDYINSDNKVDNLRGLLYRLARNLIIDLYRRKSRQPQVSLDNADQKELISAQDSLAETHKKMQASQMIKDLDKLKSGYKEILVLRYIDDLKISEIAIATQRSQVSVRVTLHRALKKLKAIREKDL
ncbi:MAG: hypothetical protein COU31_04585 [Candidatus Magasanikbacteria bacterium CG10_big_fil_rev_8_21_14_0_10_40_10]|uniref:RNA polymerase subunit sigma-24 n=1 Tax=Candidatus Magasanikbacteria bacterium CG10_big_fil_rev_8_21_14_0_10_40_10 TaxID=1974648 RepID=A0A2M6W2V7_9BACT|nr:MAG: hypothetical protein COU31_04585 [Candidatus Magasanikbacteria bacterium CG10_big_fil_rev_8_21_14_0_10_40_10]